MSTSEPITYTCRNCGYQNAWTRDEILQRGEEVVYRGDQEEIFSLPCKNPNVNCTHRTRVAVPVQ
jgi:hypothetical protein